MNEVEMFNTFSYVKEYSKTPAKSSSLNWTKSPFKGNVFELELS